MTLRVSDGRHQEGLVFYPDRVTTWTDRFHVMDTVGGFHTYRENQRRIVLALVPMGRFQKPPTP